MFDWLARKIQSNNDEYIVFHGWLVSKYCLVSAASIVYACALQLNKKLSCREIGQKGGKLCGLHEIKQMFTKSARLLFSWHDPFGISLIDHPRRILPAMTASPLPLRKTLRAFCDYRTGFMSFLWCHWFQGGLPKSPRIFPTKNFGLVFCHLGQNISLMAPVYILHGAFMGIHAVTKRTLQLKVSQALCSMQIPRMRIYGICMYSVRGNDSWVYCMHGIIGIHQLWRSRSCPMHIAYNNSICIWV